MGTEGIQDKYINPYADFGFKLLFGTAMNKELFEAAEIAKFNPKELGEYWESLKNFRDWYSVMSTQLKKGREEGLKEGIEKGLKKGLEQGRKEECFKNAKKMKQAGIAFDVIAQVTGLSIGCLLYTSSCPYAVSLFLKEGCLGIFPSYVRNA